MRTKAITLLMMASAQWGSAFSDADADLVIKSHLDAFYQTDEDRAWFKEHTEGGVVSYWMWAEQMEMILDAYERSKEEQYLTKFGLLYKGFVREHGESWHRNEFNDDIMWMVIACSRAYLLSNNPAYLKSARENFDLCYQRAWSEDLGGGLWWKTENRSKNACVNGPGAIAAFLLSQCTGEEQYAVKARACYDWLKNTLVDPESGEVFDHIRRDGRLGRRCYSYNLGTMVGAAHLLGDFEGARLSARYTMNSLSDGGTLPEHGEQGDGGGFNGICLRWIARFAHSPQGEKELEEWVQKNAQMAWDIRRESDGLSWSFWPRPTGEGRRYSWGCSSSVVALQVAKPTEESVPSPLRDREDRTR